jgi:hypothetical protein
MREKPSIACATRSRDFIVSRAGTNPEDGCGDYYMSERYNPHRLIDDGIAQKDVADG